MHADRPEARNAMTPAMYFGIKYAVNHVGPDPDLAGVLITGTGDAFAPGGKWAAAVRGAIDIAGGVLRPAPSSVLNGPVGNMPRYTAVDVSLSDVRRVCDEFRVTLNDVAPAAIPHSYRELLIGRGENPGRIRCGRWYPSRCVRQTPMDEPDNRVSLLLPHLPVDKADPLQQQQAVHRRLTQVKGQRTAAGRKYPRDELTIMGPKVARLLPIPPIVRPPITHGRADSQLRRPTVLRDHQ